MITRPTHPYSAATLRRTIRRLAVPVVIASVAALAITVGDASASIVPTVNLATAGSYSVIGSTTVTNTGPSVLDKSIALSPGTAVDGFPPGIVLAPGSIQAANATSDQARADLTTAYLDAAGRSVEFTQNNPDLTGTTLAPGVYAGLSKAPLSLSGQMTLDGQNDPNAVFIFQTDSTLTTGPGSSILLINGASECNIFWQVGSSATIGTNSAFVGNILALTSVSVQTGATVQGRAMARNAAVTLDSNVFTSTNCALGPTPPTTVAPADTAAPGATLAPGATVATVPGFGDTDITLPRTGGRDTTSTSLIGGFALVLGAAALMLARRRRPAI
jgi:LPXTG-motif cell wall-anchored protein